MVEVVVSQRVTYCFRGERAALIGRAGCAHTSGLAVATGGDAAYEITRVPRSISLFYIYIYIYML